MHKSHSSPPNYCHYHPPPPPNYCHCHYHPPPPKLVNGYPRWNRHRRLYRSHLRMNNVDWASDDEEEGEADYYQYQYPCHHEQPHQPMEDEYSYDSYPNTRSTTSSHTSSSSKSKSTKGTKSTKKTKSTENTCKTDTSTHDGRWTTTNDEKWTIATVMSNNDDCSCISDETNLSHEVHNYFVG